MEKKIIYIDENRCVGCGLCVNACQENAIALIDGKAKLMREDYCDGLGNCLPACPTKAISFRVKQGEPHSPKQLDNLPCGCPGTHAKPLKREPSPESILTKQECIPSLLNQWPVQIKLVPPQAPFFHQAKLLIAADCTAYAFANFHQYFMKNKITLIGCPKLDEGDYTEKLTEIIISNDIKSVTVVRMEVPCCGGLENAVQNALQKSGKFLQWQVLTISTEGRILD